MNTQVLFAKLTLIQMGVSAQLLMHKESAILQMSFHLNNHIWSLPLPSLLPTSTKLLIIKVIIPSKPCLVLNLLQYLQFYSFILSGLVWKMSLHTSYLYAQNWIQESSISVAFRDSFHAELDGCIAIRMSNICPLSMWSLEEFLLRPAA